MRRLTVLLSFFAVIMLLITAVAWGQSIRIIDSKHNLSVSGPGSVRASGEQQVCIFCHTPHNAASVQPLWNRALPVSSYRVYSSNSLQATPGQPTGSSKMCLSCHDGTIALGSVISRNQPIMMAGGMTTLATGRPSNLGTDLSDDHPISFKYDATLVTKNPSLKSPANISTHTRLDYNGELQCSSCHEPHSSIWGNFLVMNNDQSQLCNSCHQTGLTSLPTHSTCNACHKTHTSPSGPYLLSQQTVTATCTACHSNSAPALVRGTDIRSDLTKASPHDNNPPVNLVTHKPNNVNCRDCHQPHTMQPGGEAVSSIPANFGKISGINAAGTTVAQAQYTYEVCFKCHADQPATSMSQVPVRQITQPNIRRLVIASAVSYHPIIVPGKNTNVPSLIPPLTYSSTITCGSCHASESSKIAGGSGANGPHGSNNKPLLSANYATADATPESEFNYALCYKCHDRNNILADRSFSRHNRHLVNVKAPCSACHDSHGIAAGQGNPVNNAHLINFDLSIVQPFKGVIRYTSTGTFTGNCTLICHNKVHNSTDYKP